jgi:murein DD-endopeptidase MepM/ murein hydrolase activator NlpD
MMKTLIFTALLLSAGFAINLPTLDTVINLGPLTFYPDNPDDRLYKLPFDSGVSYPVNAGAFNRPSSHHKGYEFDWMLPWGTPVLATRAGYVTFIGLLNGNGANCIQISRLDRDSITHYTTADYYLHIQIDDPVVSIGEYVEQGQLVAYIGEVGMVDHLHLEIQMRHHLGIGGFKRGAFQPIESVPAPFVEITQRPDGIPWRDDVCVSQNKRYTPLKIEKVRVGKKASAGDFSIFPNPIRLGQNFRIGFTNPSEISIYGIDGRLVRRLNGLRLDKTDFSAGQYVFQVKSEGVLYRKMVVVH